MGCWKLREAFIYAIGDGVFMTYRKGLDTDKDGSIRRASSTLIRAASAAFFLR